MSVQSSKTKDNLSGVEVYYYNDDYSRPITIHFFKNNNVCVNSSYWSEDFGLLNTNTNEIILNTLGKGLMHNNYIEFEQGGRWHKDKFKYKSQLGQDSKVLKFYNYKKEGFFIEIGASDGIELSNTFLLETYYNWKGICVEPVPEKFELLVNNRVNSKCCNKPIYNESDLTVEFDIAQNFDLLSGISANIDVHKEKVNANKTTIQLKTLSFNDLLDRYNAPAFIDYLSLDTEGSEYEILKNFNFNKYIFGLIDVEHNYVEPKRTHIRELLIRNNYIYIGENDWDDYYKHKSV